MSEIAGTHARHANIWADFIVIHVQVAYRMIEITYCCSYNSTDWKKQTMSSM